MDWFTDVLTTFLDLGTFQLCCCLWRVRELSEFIRNILICALKVLRVYNDMRVSTSFDCITSFGWLADLDLKSSSRNHVYLGVWMY